jgi:hypothetical protein
MGKLRLVLVPAALVAASFVAGAQAESGMPLVFAANHGQAAPGVLFQARAPGLVASVRADGLELDLAGDPLRLAFRGAAASAAEGLEPRAARAHFLGAERAVRDVPTFARVRLSELHPGVALEVYEHAGRIEYDLVLAPHADPEGIALVLTGGGTSAIEATIDADGALCARSGAAVLRQLAPRAWQVAADGTRTDVGVRWVAHADGSFGFAVAPHERTGTLVVDPLLVFSAYVGGSNADEGSAVFVDEQGFTYVTGWARSVDFPVTGGGLLGPSRGKEGVVFKLGRDGRELVWATYFGGRDDDEGVALHVTATGETIVAGHTQSHDFPVTEKAFGREAAGGVDGFVLRLSADGSEIVFASYVGGSAEDTVAGLAVTASGQTTLAGTTRSRDFPVSSGSFCGTPRGARDAFVVRLDPLGERMVFSTLLGGADDDECRALAVDEEGCTYLVGRTLSHDFPTTLCALDRERCGPDAFVVKLSAGGRTLLYSTFLGGTGADEANGVAVDAERRAIVVGSTQSQDFPFDAGYRAPGRRDGFAVRLSTTGNALLHAVPLGGASADEALGVTLDAHGAAWVVGRTRSADLPLTRDALQKRLAGAADGFLVRLAGDDGRLLYASFVGGEGDDHLAAVHADRTGTAVVACGASSDVPVERRGPLAGKRRGPSDALVLRVDPRASAPSAGKPPLQAGLGF